ncbi:MAG: 3-deoxy-8-phosphooctulonate synthase [Gemmatimonadetes bacterium]|nr:3-deoxy-8-phosphooctulonate synthase [Gemmatimonadota bacterium]
MTGAAPAFFAPGGANDGSSSFFLIAGPCVVEEEALNVRIAEHVAAIATRLGVRTLFKASFDKANRSSAGSARGPGVGRGLDALARVREATGLPVITDIHLPEQAEAVAEAVDAVQIPAFLCRQTDLLTAAGATGKPVNVKKGQWMAPEHIGGAVEKLRAAGAGDIALTERGTAFGYGRWVVDMRSFDVMRESTGCVTVFDASHAVQLPGGMGSASGGEPRFIETLAGAAMAAGADGLFVEVHPDPSVAPSDGANMLPLDRLEALVERCLAVQAALDR